MKASFSQRCYTHKKNRHCFFYSLVKFYVL